ncbi:hypothetical protein [Dysgonomonas sp. 520]|uniref:hypothetical protein n=1 Tax=Dysgonomonas sp. 520 TaxID=2302931 RepID=UPI0013CFC3F2|nr:hypothetical protein [Dysgonomonas sp. 520]NDW09840.1 hypothetical protein [Dysgonomonas sp. 520]
MDKKELKKYIQVNKKLAKDAYKMAEKFIYCREDGGYEETVIFETKNPEIKSPTAEFLHEIGNYLFNIGEECRNNIETAEYLLKELEQQTKK